jgi:flagellar motor switch protein FliN
VDNNFSDNMMDADSFQLPSFEDVLKEAQGDDEPYTPSMPSMPSMPVASMAERKESSGIDLLLDVPLRMSVVLGKTTKTIREVLGLGPGSVMELDKMAGEPVDIMVNDKLIAHGEVVVVDENFGVRVTDIVTLEQRLNSLR